jgi:Cu(I)/Ag(I) efflux system membrane fusion protein
MNKSMLLVSSLTLVIGIGVGYLMFGSGNAPEASIEQKNQPLFYRNPMNPDVTSPLPAKDSMGMDYIPVYADNEASEVVGTVKIDPVVVHNIGVRTAIAKRTSISRTIRAVGRVDFDEERMSRLHPKVEGGIEEIRVDKTGQTVAKDDILLSIYSPKLVSTQQEYLLALNNLSALEKSPFEEIQQGARDLVTSSRERLKLLDVPKHQIRELEQTRKIKKSLHIHAPVAGTVIRIGSRQGQYVTPQTELYMMVDLNQVWVYADVYEYELPWVKLGDEVEMTLASVPGKIFKGALSYIYPYAQPKTRTTKVRLVFDNSDLLLRPDMFAEVNIQADTLDDVVVIPAEAVIRSGDRTQVFLVRSPGKFEPRIVRLGIESNGQVAILDGVDVGDEVVTSAQFLVDSESKLREATAKMMETLKGDSDGVKGMSGGKTMDHESIEETDPSDMPLTEPSEHAPQRAHDHD